MIDMTGITLTCFVNEWWNVQGVQRIHFIVILLGQDCQEEFVAQLLVLVTKKQKFKLTVSEGWYSAQEMKDELKWSQWVPQNDLNMDGSTKLKLTKTYKT